MTLSALNITKEAILEPPRITIFGEPKIGKTTFAADAPDPLVIDLENGSKHMNVSRVTDIDTFDKFVDVIRTLQTEKHDYKTLVIDSVDWLERIIHAKVAEENNVKSIDDIGYGKGYQGAVEKFSFLLTGLDKLRLDNKMAIIFIGHGQIKTFHDPMRESYDRHTLKLHHKLEGLLIEWSDAILFATKKVYTTKEDGGFNKKIVKAASSDQRIIMTNNSPCALAGNRYGLPDELPLEWKTFAENITQSKGK